MKRTPEEQKSCPPNRDSSYFLNHYSVCVMENECKKNILLIDDDDDELEIFITALNELHITYNCCCARSAPQAMKILSNMVPDLILLDVNMSGTNGIQCLSQIKQMKAMKKVPVIVYSTCMDNGAIQDAATLGAACIKKTSNVKSLTAALKEVFSLHSIFDPYPIVDMHG